jgi:hypothetical protein
MDGFGFDIGGNRRTGGGHGGHGHGGHGHHKHHHHRHQNGGGDFAPPPPPDDDGGDGGSGDDGSGDMGHESGCSCGGTCGHCQERIGFTGHYGPDLYHDNSLAPMGQDDDFGCDPLGSCTRPFTMGWEYDGPGSFGGELSKPILSNWGRYPSRSPLTGVFAGDLTKPILSNWGRYPHGSPYTGVFGDDGDVMTMPMDTITANPSSSGMAPDSNPSTSGLGGILDAVSTVAQGVSSVVAAANPPRMAPHPPSPLGPGRLGTPVRHPYHPHHPRAALAPLPYFNPPPPYYPYYPPPPPPPMIPYRRPAGYPPGYTGGAVWVPSDPGY